MPTPTAYFEGGFVPLPEAKIGVMTHAFNYGTAVFEGVRGNWNEEHGELYLFKLRDHVRRIRQSAKIMRLGISLSEDEMVDVIVDLARRNGYREDVYIRPIVYKSSQQIGLRIHNLDDDFLVYVAPPPHRGSAPGSGHWWLEGRRRAATSVSFHR